MIRKRVLSLMVAAICLLTCVLQASAAEVDCDAIYCFTSEDFDTEADPLAGICITDLPDASVGTMLLGVRVLRCGDILTADQLAQVTFSPVRTQTDTQATLTYLPIFESRVAPAATMTISVRGKEDKAPTAQDMAVETYKNLPNEGKLKVKDPEGQELTFTVIRQPRRGTVEVRSDGSFVYTPKKNKVGVDSFTFTAADPSGNVSREATVTVTILKPSEATQYTDTAGKSCRFAAEWMKNTGIFVGETINGNGCFQPEKEVSRGDFLTMLVGALEIPVESDSSCAGFSEDAPRWLQPYLAAALRSGLTTGLPKGGNFRSGEPITGAEAAVMIQNALDLGVQTVTADEAIPIWAQQAVSVLADHGINLEASAVLTRGQAAEVLYRVAQLKADAPGSRVIRGNR